MHYAEDFMPHIANALKRLACEHDFTLKVVINKATSQPRIDGVKIEFVEWELESFESHLMTFDIGLCPSFSNLIQLADPITFIRTPNRVNTLLFYGIPSVASPLPQSCQFLKNEETVLFAVSEEGWYDAIKKLITQPDLRNHIGQSGRDMVTTYFSENAACDAFLKLLNTETEMPLFPKKGFKVAPQTQRSKLSEFLQRSYSYLKGHISMVNKGE
jgi:glycosyltransferase involved in cell wall biosynthesis